MSPDRTMSQSRTTTLYVSKSLNWGLQITVDFDGETTVKLQDMNSLHADPKWRGSLDDVVRAIEQQFKV